MLSQEFEEKVFTLKDRLFRFALMLVQNREDAEDVVQEILAKLWSMRMKLNALTSIQAYALTMVRNESLNRIKATTRRWSSLEKVDALMSEQQPENQFQRKETFQVLLSFISHLPEQQQLVIMLRDVEGLEMHEIESITNMTGNNIRVTLSLARKKIADLYEAYESHERK
jgi:RNA polymerase sigma factor (sigma-70 family)